MMMAMSRSSCSAAAVALRRGRVAVVSSSSVQQSLPSHHPHQRVAGFASSKKKKRSKISGGGTRGARGHGWFHKYRQGLGERHLQGEYWDFPTQDEKQAWNQSILSLGSQLAYMDIVVGEEEPPKRIIINLTTAALPETTRNFSLLLQESTMGYENTKVHRIESQVGFCMGDVTNHDGKSGQCHPSIGEYGIFAMEYKVLYHIRGLVSMMAPGVDKVDSRFLLCTHDAPHLDGWYVGFGTLTDESLQILDDWQSNIFTKRGRPTVDMTIVKCGLLQDEKNEQEEKEEESA